MTSGAGSSTSAQPACLAWYGSRGDGICLSYSNNTPVFVGTPDVSIGGPYSSSPGVGITTGPLLPGSTISRGIG